MRVPLLILALAAPQAAPGAAHSGVERWLAALSAPSAGERSRAQRELTLLVSARDLSAVRAAAVSGEAEVRRRIWAALAADDRHLDLALALARDPAREVSEIGRDALREMLARWSPGYSDPGQDRAEVRTQLRQKSERILALDADAPHESFDRILDELARAADGAPPLVLDPALLVSGARSSRANADLEGPFEQVLDGYARAYGLGYVGFAFDAELGDAARPWILVTARTDDGRKSASERILDWCLAVAAAPGGGARSGAESASDLQRAGSARALAALDWPAGLRWLEQRWRADGDASALEGLLAAAGRGRVAASFFEPRVQEDLYRALDDALGRGDAAGDARAEEIARALSAAGSSGPRGEDLAATALAPRAGGARRSPREIWARMVVLEGAHSSSPLVLPFLDACIRGETPPGMADGSPAERQALRFQALRTRRASARGVRFTGALPDPGALFEWAASMRVQDELVRCLAIAGVALPVEWLDPQRLPAAWKSAPSIDLRLAVLEWCLAPGDLTPGDSGKDVAQAAALHLAALVSAGATAPAALEQLAAGLRRATSAADPARVRSFLDAARAAAPAASADIDRLEVLSGRAGPAAEERVLAAASSKSALDLACLGALAAGGQGDAARTELLRSIAGGAAPLDLVAALERAVLEMRAARAEKEERAFVVSVRTALRGADANLQALLRADRWPPAPKNAVVRVSELDRRLSTSGL
jgi:hypothetical protein